MTPFRLPRLPGATAAVTAARRSRSSRQPVILRVARAATPGTGHRAPGSLLVAPGQGRGPFTALDCDALDPGIPALSLRVGRVDDDPLDVGPGDEHGRATADGQFVRRRAEHDARMVGATS